MRTLAVSFFQAVDKLVVKLLMNGISYWTPRRLQRLTETLRFFAS
jgi:hypothetical protein